MKKTALILLLIACSGSLALAEPEKPGYHQEYFVPGRKGQSSKVDSDFRNRLRAFAEGPDGTLLIKSERQQFTLEKKGDEIDLTEAGRKPQDFSVREFRRNFEVDIDEAAENLQTCQSHLRDISTSLELYSTDHQGHYPAHLADLVPQSMKVIPVCPVASSDTYSQTYQMTATPDHYTFFCSGNHHQLGPGLPSDNSRQGLVPPRRRAHPDYSNDPLGARQDALSTWQSLLRLKPFLAEQMKPLEYLHRGHLDKNLSESAYQKMVVAGGKSLENAQDCPRLESMPDVSKATPFEKVKIARIEPELRAISQKDVREAYILDCQVKWIKMQMDKFNQD